jgi:hypothetical protein
VYVSLGVVPTRTLGGIALVGGLAAVGLAGLAVQAFAQPANHPQVEIARAAVSRLDGGASPADVLPGRTVDIATSTDPYLIVTDSRHSVLASSASLNGRVALPPSGVFESVLSNGEDRVTWQPAAGVRSWIVVDSYRGGFVVAGRSPSSAEQSAYVLLLWGSIAAIGLAGVAGLAVAAAGRGDLTSYS